MCGGHWQQVAALRLLVCLARSSGEQARALLGEGGEALPLLLHVLTASLSFLSMEVGRPDPQRRSHGPGSQWLGCPVRLSGLST